MVRREIVESVINGDGVSDRKQQKKSVFIASHDANKTDFDRISKYLKLKPESPRYNFLKAFCEAKAPSIGDTKSLISRTKSLSDEQLAILELITRTEDFTVKNIFGVVRSMRKLGTKRLLILRCFIDLGNIGPGRLYQFFRTTLPCGGPDDMGKEAYEKEVRDKHIRPDQINAFYNICQRVDGINPGTAIAILPKIRKLKKQHAELMNSFLTPNACFGDKPINGKNILSLLNLWVDLPVPKDHMAFRKLVKKLALEPEEKKTDFRFIALTYKTEVRKMESGKTLVSSIRSFFGKSPQTTHCPG